MTSAQQYQINDEQIINKFKQQINKLQHDIAHYEEKHEVQSKRLKYAKKQNEELKLKKVQVLKNSSEIKEQNITLKQSNKLLKEQLKLIQQELAEYTYTNIFIPKEVILREVIVNSQTEEVDLPKYQIKDQDIETIKPFSNNIKTLILGENSITSSGMNIICQNFKELKKLFINHNQIDDQGISSIVNLKNLKCFDIRCNKITNKSMEYISTLTQLSQLSISNNNLTDQCLNPIYLTKLSSSLKYLDITSNHITEKGGLQLRNLEGLTNLYLSHNKITQKCVYQYLQKMKQLRVLDIRFNEITKEQKQEIRDKYEIIKKQQDKRPIIQMFL